jgi:TatA/E family protein of Tat protein translocase
MFGIDMPELLVIFVLALLVFGPKELPRIARTLGRTMAELRRASDALTRTIRSEMEALEREEPIPPPAVTPEAPPPPPLEAAPTAAETAGLLQPARPEGTNAGAAKLSEHPLGQSAGHGIPAAHDRRT